MERGIMEFIYPKTMFTDDTKVITLCRLRTSETYNKPLESLVEPFFVMYKDFTYRHIGKYDFRYYNCGYDTSRVCRISRDLEDADVLVIPTECEFTYHIKGRQSNFSFQRTWNNVETMREVLRKCDKPKHIVLLTSDRADTVSLFRNNVFEEFPNYTYSVIDECDFFANAHHIKNILIEDNFLNTYPKPEKVYDFVYWGTSKRYTYSMTSESVLMDVKRKGVKRYKQRIYEREISHDLRHDVLKAVSRSDLDSLMIGYFEGFKYDIKFTRKFGTEVVPHLCKARTTLCFNWPGYDKFSTARYNEAVACDVVPLVWKNYDINNILVADDYQRVNSFEELEQKCIELRDAARFFNLFNKVREKYYSVARDLEYYNDTFSDKLERQLK